MAVTSGKTLREKLHESCCQCKQVRDKVNTRRALQDAVESSEARPTTTIDPSTSFRATPNPR